MTAAITLAGWLLIFGAWFALAFGAAIAIGKAFSLNTRLDNLARAERLEVNGPMSQFYDRDAA